ncbi:MAG: FAD-dependent oxidoreductase [Peptococcaceae bacterium]|nr:FAD-dependent oxidoreductase [Peptococcaceae bacterium]MDH7526389.1 FAD-dependent oxidoreductase [Peptococcaceae bacterium]
MKFNHAVVESDVLIIGSGCAGLGAALEVAKLGRNAVVVEKGERSGHCGASIMAIQLACAALGLYDDDSPELHALDTVKWGGNICNKRLVSRMTEEAPARILEFYHWGMKFDTKDGKLNLLASPGHSRRRALFVDFKYGTGRSMMQALNSQLIPHAGRIKYAGYTHILELLVSDGEAAGAVGFDFEKGEIKIFRSKAVILATGGGMEIYGRNSGSKHLTGDGYHLAYKAGVPLQDMEFIQFIPMGTLYPHIPGMVMTILEPISYRTGGRVTNGRGEEFLGKYDSRGLKATRDIIGYAMAKEVLEGRGTPHGGIYFEPGTAGADALINEYGQEFIDKFIQAGVDITKERVEVYPIAHYFMGGAQVDIDGRTVIPGLFCAGEVVGGIHGANRLAGNSLTDVMVFGKIVGRAAGEESTKRALLPLDINMVANETGSYLAGRLCRLSDPEASVTRLKEVLQEKMLSKAGPVRWGNGLEEALQKIVEIEKEYLPRTGVSDLNPVFNQELADILNLESMLTTAKLVVQSALAREESRGAHKREDFPEEKQEWVANVVVKRKPGSILPEVEKQAVR